MLEREAVRARDCACPNTPHEEGDIVYLLPKPSLACGLAAQGDIAAAGGDGTVLAQRWLMTYVKHGAVGWNLTDDKGREVPFDLDELLADYSFALPVAERAGELYSDAILRPLQARLNGTSQSGSIAASTSPRVRSMTKRRGSSSPAPSVASVPSMP